jgi:hypothetical protein
MKSPKSRPKSFSEGYDVSNQFPKHDELFINQIYDEISEQSSEEKKDIIPKPNMVGIIYVKMIGFLFHLVLISIFEVIFFNYFIIQYEDNALISLTDQLISPILNSCQVLSNTSKTIVDDFINIFINETTINNNALSDYNIRHNYNYKLYIYSIEYCIGTILAFFMLLSMNYFFKQKIDYLMIILDNMTMICILGVYEFIFFKTIIFKYMTISPHELVKNIVANILHKC